MTDYLSPTQRRERFRAVLAGDACAHPVEVFDAVSARIAEDLGFEIGFLTGGTAQATIVGGPDLFLVTLTEFVDQVRRICRASSISLMVDPDHGYGNALNVIRTVQELEDTGVAALSIKDGDLPTAFGSSVFLDGTAEKFTEEEPAVSVEEAVGKMKAAVAARRDRSLVIIARTRPLRNAGGISETVERVKAYEQAGVDAIYLAYTLTPDGLEELHNATRLPLLIGHNATRDLNMDDTALANMGIRLATQGRFALHASIKAMYDAFKALRDGKSPTEIRDSLASPELLAQVTRQSNYENWIKDYLH